MTMTQKRTIFFLLITIAMTKIRGFALYKRENIDQVRIQNPEITTKADINAILSKQFKALSKDEKKEFKNRADKLSLTVKQEIMDAPSTKIPDSMTDLETQAIFNQSYHAVLDFMNEPAKNLDDQDVFDKATEFLKEIEVTATKSNQGCQTDPVSSHDPCSSQKTNQDITQTIQNELNQDESAFEAINPVLQMNNPVLKMNKSNDTTSSTNSIQKLASKSVSPSVDIQLPDQMDSAIKSTQILDQINPFTNNQFIQPINFNPYQNINFNPYQLIPATPQLVPIVVYQNQMQPIWNLNQAYMQPVINPQITPMFPENSMNLVPFQSNQISTMFPDSSINLQYDNTINTKNDLFLPTMYHEDSHPTIPNFQSALTKGDQGVQSTPYNLSIDPADSHQTIPNFQSALTKGDQCVQSTPYSLSIDPADSRPTIPNFQSALIKGDQGVQSTPYNISIDPADYMIQIQDDPFMQSIVNDRLQKIYPNKNTPNCHERYLPTPNPKKETECDLKTKYLIQTISKTTSPTLAPIERLIKRKNDQEQSKRKRKEMDIYNLICDSDGVPDLDLFPANQFVEVEVPVDFERDELETLVPQTIIQIQTTQSSDSSGPIVISSSDSNSRDIFDILLDQSSSQDFDVVERNVARVTVPNDYDERSKVVSFQRSPSMVYEKFMDGILVADVDSSVPE
jgi:hypothetical protein